ncbi:hypothetical protein FACS1894219_07080 [Clostridia bacterium]|nr:hypothetical protein FACS1894219_07080 [Clostridia bacterium]
MSSKKIPVILDTDIGGDIDDTWALAMLINSPELDLKLVTTSSNDPLFGAKIVGKLLDRAGRPDVQIGLGINTQDRYGYGYGNQKLWIEGYDLYTRKGVDNDGVGRLIKTIMDSPEKITVLAIGPLHNVYEALNREPRIADKARFVGMHGSIHLGYGGAAKPDAEWNVVADPYSCREVFKAPWEVTITPVDTCGLIVLEGEYMRRIKASEKPLAKAVIENYSAWLGDNIATLNVENKSSTLFDTVAVYLAFSEELLNIEELPIKVTYNGFTQIDEKQPKKIRCATSWKDMEAFNKLLTDRIIV